MNKLIVEIINLPLWVQILMAFVVVCLLDGVYIAWGEHRFIAELAEATIARAFYLGTIFGSFGLGVYSGIKTYEKSDSTILGWTIGVVVFVIVGITSGLVAKEVPGVGWRYELMMSND